MVNRSYLPDVEANYGPFISKVIHDDDVAAGRLIDNESLLVQAENLYVALMIESH